MQTTAPPTKGAAESRHVLPGSSVATLREAVAGSGLPELAGEVRLDDFVRVAADLLAVPLVAVSLFDGQREKLIARIGWDVAELPSPVALGGALTSRGPGIQVVADAREDSVLREHPLVAGHARVRFCAAAPLVDGAGTVWGAFLVADCRPRTLRPAEQRLLEFLAAQVLRLLEAVRQTHALVETVAEHEHVRASLRLRTNLLQLQQVIASAANEATSLPEVLQSVLQLVGAYTGWPLGHAWLLAENARRPSEPARLWQATSTARYDAVIKTVEGYDPKAREQRLRELAGDEMAIRVVALGADSVDPVAAPARASGLGAEVVVPVGTGGRVDAMLAFFCVEAEPLNDRLSQVLAYIATQVGRVIERRLAEAALRQSEESFRALIENGSDVITILDGRGTIRYISPSVERILARPPPELTGRSVLTLVHPGDLVRTTAVLARLVANPGQMMVLEFRAHHADGTYRNLEGVGRYTVDPVSGFKGIIATFRDLTERKRAEAELQQTNQRLTETMAELQQTQQQVIQQERLRALGQMASGIAHDFNNALAPILGFSELLL
ncbi:PAS domain S-box protein, partial [bacterium]|nr:PAS domain S-box protein [bacterium]